tara:strand:+ start:1734 stop:1853 length:120 start_codon:yes stop_codon:yes gene_type:complete
MQLARFTECERHILNESMDDLKRAAWSPLSRRFILIQVA